MSFYGVIFPEFWTGRTGRDLRARGGKEAQLLGLYLATNRHANMLGLYRLLVDDVKHETGLTLNAIERGYNVTTVTEFAVFDPASSYVWVRQMARFRLGLKTGDRLQAQDKRVMAINRLYTALEPNPFLAAFFDLNHDTLKLHKRRMASGLVVPPTGDHDIDPLTRGMQAPYKPVTEIRVQSTEIKVQRSGTEGAPKARPDGPDAVPSQQQRRRHAADGRAGRAASATVVEPPDRAALRRILG